MLLCGGSVLLCVGVCWCVLCVLLCVGVCCYALLCGGVRVLVVVVCG